MLSGLSLYIPIAALIVALAFLCWLFRNARRIPAVAIDSRVRKSLTILGLALAIFALLSFLALHLSWTSPDVSQRLGNRSVRILSGLFFWSALLSCLSSVFGSDKRRWATIAVVIATGAWWLIQVVSLGASMSGTALTRHPVNYLVPAGYIGWVHVNYGEEGMAPLPNNDGIVICRIPTDGTLATSSLLEDGWAKDTYWYYSGSGTTTPLEDTGWGKGGMIWDENVSMNLTRNGSAPAKATESFFVGTEAQFKNGVQRPSQN